jgi:uncharacterized membrane protein HdeD (DUF308 family)
MRNREDPINRVLSVLELAYQFYRGYAEHGEEECFSTSIGYSLNRSVAGRRISMLQNVGAQIARRNWWMLALRGVLAIIFGLIALFFPGIVLFAFIVVFAVYAIIDGIFAVAVAIRERESLGRWGWLLIEGCLSIIAGILAFAFPRETALVLLFIIAAWAILTGLMEIVAAFSLRDFLAQEWALALAGIISVLFGAILFARPGAGILAILWLVGIYSIIFGVLFIIRAFQLRSWASSVAA